MNEPEAQVDPVYPMAHWQRLLPMHWPLFWQADEQVTEGCVMMRGEEKVKIRKIPARRDRKMLARLKSLDEERGSDGCVRVMSLICKVVTERESRGGRCERRCDSLRLRRAEEMYQG